jgi:hypothetical protein
MVTRIKRIHENCVMCTVQGCAAVAEYFVSATSAGPAAYCETHAEDAARQLGHPWPVLDCKPPQKVSRNLRSLVG